MTTDFEPRQIAVGPVTRPPFPVPVTSMCLAKNAKGDEVLYVAAGRVVYCLEEREGRQVFVPLEVMYG